ncbi:3-hydroxyacyl-CoA dehydrogenase NAD-binding domain-containing protein [Tabrizicola sp.]|uniref:3-hydroxyacyl-CoA dehydrogenase n=1 Tax=Tabrizicola sp. TaxID=2005166 RepID=UPI00286CC4D5|nr:3-hydroxyacyl-CoA dehydrogenase NAD-binding domain-containing protein [Tabrizicola sp.]
MTTIAIIGLGTMGLGLAQLYAAAGFAVRATDADAAIRDSAKPRLAEALALRVTSGKLTSDASDATLANLTVTRDLASLAPASLAIEAIVERLDAKHALFADLEPLLPGAVLATNTSSLSVAAIAEGLRHPDRVIGLHFFNPVPAMKLVELVGHKGTSPAALTIARQLTEAAGKTVIAAPDRPGFIVNRCARPYYGEALAMLDEGRSASDIDAAMIAVGYRLGPFQLIDLIGADINLAATEGLFAAMHHHPRYHPFLPLRRQVAIGNLGRKTGQGFIFPADPGTAPKDAAAIALRIEATLVNEAAWLLSEGGTTTDGIDTAMKLGLNLPRGPFEILEAHGAPKIRAKLAALEATTALRGRYVLAPMLEAA